MKRSELFSKVIEQIKQNLSKGTIPWRRPWRIGVPMNFITRKPYNGINYLILAMNDFPSPYYLTFLQCKMLNGNIIKGSNGFPIVYWKLYNIYSSDEPDENSLVKTIPLFRVSYVFNLAQTSLFKDNMTDEHKNITAEEIIRNLNPKPIILHNIQRCYYDFQKDVISIPPVNQFNSPNEYYASLFHELIHWTGHQSRLNRLNARDNKDAKAIEEIVAELGSSFLCAWCGIEPKFLDNQSAYIESWLRLLHDKPNAFIKAIHLARQAVDFLVPQAEN